MRSVLPVLVLASLIPGFAAAQSPDAADDSDSAVEAPPASEETAEGDGGDDATGDASEDTPDLEPATAIVAEESPDADARPEGPPVRDLAALTRAARRNWPSLRAARHELVAARAQLAEATISPFFQFEATAAFTFAPEASGSPIFSPDPQLPLSNPWRPVVQVSAEGVIPIYTFGKLSSLRDAAEAGVDAAAQSEARARARLDLDVRRAYYRLQMALDILQMISEGENRLDDAEEELERRLEEGDSEVNPYDRYRLAAAIAEVQARKSEAQRLERTARRALSVLTGIDAFEVPECPLAPLETDLQPLDHYVARAAESRPELAQLDAALRARRAALDATTARYFPDIGLALRAGYSHGPGITDQRNPFVIDSANYTSLGAALVMRWSFDVWGNVHRERRAEAQLLETEARAEEARRGIQLEVAATFEEVVDAARREEAWSEGHRQTRRWFVAAASAYQVGAEEAKDLIDAIKAYFTARFSHVAAIADFNSAMASLSRVTGDPLQRASDWEVACEDDSE